MGDISVSGGGRIAVSTGDLLADASLLATVSGTVGDVARRLQVEASEPIAMLALTRRPDDGSEDLMLASGDLHSVGEATDRLAHDLRTSAENYGRAEQAAAGVLEFTGAEAGYALGAGMPFTLLALAGPLAGLALTMLAAVPITGSSIEAGVGRVGRMFGSRAGLLCDPRFVLLLRTVVSSADDAMLGAARVPLPVALVADDRGLGWFGLKGAAREAIGAASLGGALSETSVAVRRASEAQARVPTGFADLARRVPDNAEGKPQIRIEKYDVAGERPHWIVYVGGTVDPSFVATDEPWDDTSNLQGVAGLDPGSVRATEQAMRAAGVQPDDSIVAVGYSQGGIVATDLVTGGDYTNAALVTFGSPTGQVDVPSDVPDVAVEMREDIIPALGGFPLPPDDGGADRILVRRSAFDGEPPSDQGDILAAHHIGNYRTTAAMMDASRDPRLERVRATIADFTGGQTGTAEMWRADRVSDR